MNQPAFASREATFKRFGFDLRTSDCTPVHLPDCARGYWVCACVLGAGIDSKREMEHLIIVVACMCTLC